MEVDTESRRYHISIDGKHVATQNTAFNDEVVSIAKEVAAQMGGTDSFLFDLQLDSMILEHHPQTNQFAQGQSLTTNREDATNDSSLRLIIQVTSSSYDHERRFHIFLWLLSSSFLPSTRAGILSFPRHTSAVKEREMMRKEVPPKRFP